MVCVLASGRRSGTGYSVIVSSDFWCRSLRSGVASGGREIISKPPEVDGLPSQMAAAWVHLLSKQSATDYLSKVCLSKVPQKVQRAVA
jgi:hypothetical protein